MGMTHFKYTISHVPGKDLCTTDALQSPIVRPLNQQEEKLTDDVKAYVDSVIKHLPPTEDRLEELRSQQQQDEFTNQLIAYYSDGWPETSHLPCPLKAYWPERGELTVQEGLLIKGNRLVIPVFMRLDVVNKLHEGHQGIARCRERAETSV